MSENPYQSPDLVPEDLDQHKPDPEWLPTLAFRGSLLFSFLCVLLFLLASAYLRNELGELLQRASILGIIVSLVVMVVSINFVSSARRVKEANRRMRVRLRRPSGR